MNYCSDVIFGTANLLEDEAEKFEATRLFTEHIIPNRWNEIRKPNAKESKATTVLKLPTTEALGKIRTGNLIDNKADYDLNVWAGVLPLKLCAASEDDARLKSGIHEPEYLKNYQR